MEAHQNTPNLLKTTEKTPNVAHRIQTSTTPHHIHQRTANFAIQYKIMYLYSWKYKQYNISYGQLLDEVDSWLSFVMSNCEVFTFPLVSWVILSIPDLCPLSYFAYMRKVTGPEVIKLFSCSTQLSTNFIMPVIVKMRIFLAF